MRIGLSTPVIQRGRSGVGQYVLALVRALQRAASHHEFTLFVMEEDLALFEFARAAMRIVAISEAFRPPVRNVMWHQCALPRLAWRLGLEVLHVPSYRRMLWSRPCACVATIHDLAAFRVPKKYDRRRMFYGRAVARRLAWRQDQIIAVSHHTARDLAAFFGLPGHRVTVIHNGLDHERFSPGRRDDAKAMVARRHGLTSPFFLYLARLEHPAKNHVRLIAAFERFKSGTRSPWRLVLAGADWHGARVIHARIRQSPFAADIICPGFVSDGDLPAWYRAADVFVYPSLHEGFGLPPVEAMACGCPVIASTRGALEEVIGSAAAAVDPDEEESIRRQLARAAGDETLRESLRAAGLEQARRFDWRRTAAATLDVYVRAAGRSELPCLAATPGVCRTLESDKLLMAKPPSNE